MAARSLNEIYAEIINEKQNYTQLNALQPNINSLQSLLAELQTTSKVGVWRLWAYITALAIWTHEKLIDVQTTELEQRAIDIIPGTLRWYRDIATEWQQGDELFWNGVLKRYEYQPVNEANRLVQFAAAIEANNQVTLKVAKLSGVTAAALTTAELNQFTQYINLRRYAGTNVAIISAAADTVNITGTVFYDPLVLDSNGALITDNSVFPVNDAIDTFLRDLGTVNFNGVLRAIDLVDAIQATTGVVNFTMSVLQATYGVLPYTNVLALTGQEYQSNAGHLAVNTLTLTFTPDV
jgi:hypothetical protein